jgi:hypothetical protein
MGHHEHNLALSSPEPKVEQMEERYMYLMSSRRYNDIAGCHYLLIRRELDMGFPPG